MQTNERQKLNVNDVIFRSSHNASNLEIRVPSLPWHRNAPVKFCTHCFLAVLCLHCLQRTDPLINVTLNSFCHTSFTLWSTMSTAASKQSPPVTSNLRLRFVLLQLKDRFCCGMNADSACVGHPNSTGVEAF